MDCCTSRASDQQGIQAIDLVAVIQETCQIVKTSFDARVRRGRSAGTPAHHGDAAGISQVVMNLCTNARDAMPDGGRLKIEPSPLPARRGEGVGHRHRHGPGHTGKMLDPFFTTKPIGQAPDWAFHRLRHHQKPRRHDQRRVQAGRGHPLRLQFPGENGCGAG
jgi:signal transduction histidine kinase